METLCCPLPNKTYSYTYPLADGKALFGTNVIVKAPLILNNSYNNLGATIIVVPNELFPSNIILPKSILNRLLPDSINWNPDYNNQFKQVQIQFSYYKGISQQYNPGFANSIDPLIYTVADNGSFIIPQLDLTRFPKGCYVGLTNTRAFNKTVAGIAYIAITEAHSMPLLVTE